MTIPYSMPFVSYSVTYINFVGNTSIVTVIDLERNNAADSVYFMPTEVFLERQF